MFSRPRVAFVLTSGLAIAASGPALAQERPDAEGEAEIIVTARRAEERLQDVPISITVYTQQQLLDRNVVAASDLATYTPSLSVNQRYGPEKTSFAIRGFNQDLNTAPTVGVYFADVVGVRAQGGTTSGNTVGVGAFMDLQNVQVLKGPQGTLFGRNTTGGAILLVPSRPTGQFEGWIEGQTGNYALRRVQGVLNVPVTDSFKVRVAVDRNKRDGYLKNRSGIGPKRYANVDYFAARLSILAELAPGFENYTIAHYSNSFANGIAARINVCNPTPTAAASRTAVAGCGQLARAVARGDGPFDVDVDNANPFLKLRQWQVINTTTWEANDDLTVKNILSYGQFKERFRANLYGDNFFGPQGQKFQHVVVNPAEGGANASQSTFTEELQLVGKAFGDSLSWQAGGYLEFSRPLAYNAAQTAILLNCTDETVASCTNPFGIGQMSQSATKLIFDNHGLYSQATLKLTSKLSATAGFRYTFDKIVGVSESTRRLALATPTERFVCYDTVRFTNPDGSRPKRITDRSECRFQLVNKSNRPTWLVNLDYKPTDDMLLYAKYARGYRQGGINFGTSGSELWGPEKLDAYEIGAKIGYRGAVSGYLNFAGFYNNLKGQQIVGTVAPRDPSVVASGGAIVNAGLSRIKGVEIDASINAAEGLQLTLGYTYLDAKVIKLVPITLPPNSPYQSFTPSTTAGARPTLTPKHRMTMSINYTLPVAETLGKITVGGNYTYTDKQVAVGGIPAIAGVIQPTNIFNLNANWESFLSSSFDLGFYMTNVTNKAYAVNAVSFYSSAGYDGVFMGQPRIFGVRARYNF